MVKRKTAKNRMSRALRTVSLWCQSNRHQPIASQHYTLSQKVRGHCAYYGLTGNSAALGRFVHFVGCIWHKWLNRRNRQRELRWSQFNALLSRFPLPNPRIVHGCT